MELHELKPPKNSKKKRKRVGRGPGSGMGKTSGRGHGGQNSRSGSTRRIGFEGGQMPLNRRVPKFGFTNIFRKEFQVVNLADIARCKPGEVDAEKMKQVGLIKNTRTPVKVLGNGEVKKAYFVKAAAFSKTAIAKIETAGGEAEVVKC
jgi:large subunit ribosomal protein L15